MQSRHSAVAARETANDRFKRRSGVWVWRGIIAAAAVHFAVFALFPRMSVAGTSVAETPTEVVSLPELELPPPPPELPRPAAPVASADVPVDVTVPSTDFSDYGVEDLPPPPTAGEAERERFEAFVPTMVAPRVLNPREVERALERTYPPLLRDAGIGGTVGVLLWVDETGRIVRARVAQSSGHDALDRAALEVTDVMRLSPALNRDRAVPVTVTLPIRFEAR